MVEVVSYLHANNFKIFIVSGSDRQALRILTDGIMPIEKDNIIGIESSNLYESSFNGFDVLWIYFNTEGVAFRMRKLKIFAQER